MLQSLCSLFLFMLLFGDSLTEPRKQLSRMIDGNYAARSQFPYQVSIEHIISTQNGSKDTDYYNICGGGLLASKWVVTSVSCLLLKLTSYRVVAGVIDLKDMSKYRQERVPIEFIIHPEYDGLQLKYDFGLIKVPPFRFSQYVKPVKLPSIARPKETFPSGVAEVAGWGTMVPTSDHLTFRLNYIRIMLPDDEAKHKKCYEWFPHFKVDYHFCSFPQNKKEPCHFSYGSPLVQNGTIQGIISKTDSPCVLQSPTIYSDVAKALEFFKKYIHDQKSKFAMM